MSSFDPFSARLRRRDLLRLGGAAALAAALPLPGRPLLRAAAATAQRTPGSLPFPARPAGVPAPDLAPELAPIEHIVIVMQENHSFDNYLGMLPYRVPARAGQVDGFPTLGADGVPLVYQTDPKGHTYRAFPLPNGCQAASPGPSQSWDSSHLSYDSGAMDGFLQQSGEIAVGYWDDTTLPFLYSLATTFPVCDRWFSSTLCQTYPNRVFMMAGTAAGLISTDTPPPTVTPRNGHIFDVLEHHGIGWVDYYTDLPSPGLFGIPWAAQREGRNFVGPFASTDGTIAAFQAAVTANALPPVVMVESDYQYASEENPQDIGAGQHFVSGVVAALMSNPTVWQRTLLIYTYDEHGGYYDHVPPPAAPNPGDGSHPSLPQSRWYGDDYTQLGIRVPAVVVSPWARPGFVSHTVYDHTSILATIQRKWNLPALTYRDANANHLGECLVSSGPAPFATPPAIAAAPNVTQAQSLACEEVPGSAGTYPGPVSAPAHGGTPNAGAFNTAGLATRPALPMTGAPGAPGVAAAAAAVTAAAVAARRLRSRTPE